MALCPPGMRAMTQGCAGAMPPSAAKSQPQLPQLGEGKSLPCVAPLLVNSPCPSSFLCLWDHSSAGDGWEGPRQQRGDA